MAGRLLDQLGMELERACRAEWEVLPRDIRSLHVSSITSRYRVL